MNGWMDGWMDRCVDGRMDSDVVERLERWLGGLILRWMDDW